MKEKIFLEHYFKCDDCTLKHSKKECNRCTHSFYKLNLFLNLNKKQLIKKILKLVTKNNVLINVGACPEIYKEKIFKKIKFFQNKG